MTTDTETTTQPTAAETQDLSPEEVQRMENVRLRDEVAALKKDRAECIELAEEANAKRRDFEDMKARAKKAKDELDALLTSLEMKIRGEVQTEIDPSDEEQAEIEFEGAPAGHEPLAAERTGDVLKVAGIDWSQVEQSALSALVSTGKPSKVKPVEILGLSYVLVDVQDRVAILHQVMDGQTFADRHAGLIGAVRPDERNENLAGYGAYCGIPVRVGRKVQWLAAEPFLVEIPKDAAISTSTEPVGSGMVENRIFAQLEASPTVEHMTVHALALLLGVSEEIVRNSVKASDRLVYELYDEGNGEADEHVSRAEATE